MASVTQLGYIGISASNLEEWEHFGTEVLGLQSNGVDSDGVLTMRMDEYTHRFIVSPTGKDDVEFVGFQVTDQGGPGGNGGAAAGGRHRGFHRDPR